MLLLYQQAPSDTKFLGFRATARSSPRFCFPTRRRAECGLTIVGLLSSKKQSVFSTAVPHESENARQHTFPKLCVVPDGPWSTPDSRACGGATRTRQAFSFYQQCACALRQIQSSRIVVLVHKLERNHSCFDILLIYYFSLKIYFSGSFDEVREGCGCFQDNKVFFVDWSREVGYCCKNATTYLTAIRC